MKDKFHIEKLDGFGLKIFSEYGVRKREGEIIFIVSRQNTEEGDIRDSFKR